MIYTVNNQFKIIIKDDWVVKENNVSFEKHNRFVCLAHKVGQTNKLWNRSHIDSFECRTHRG